ncbi:hypothetical protein K493DRAFT_285400 [Basidiobolus meristosporus CBS 931.73]|uniref:Uncharacterized protein n=1 Tax=Basidiobolus meristosporus CBS 931.73 TaxID=1314790 RepID=A0A1Y1Y456_9FUNG|nr:hypothetical protein K493DRAFT_285400 [Basidiobolus meristosporus CBS 931.73]|eukprot:ORX92749.1 hypothetical protein K493DRAFT_285400 [Basidiobolus meristosporus CBS 931.73]
MITIMSKVVTRPNPQIQLGPVDMSCAFVTVDARQYDFPIVYCSHSFEELTGYTAVEVLGRNCRFLQAPDGQVTAGSRRRFTDNNVVTSIKNCIGSAKEIQVSLVNYKKGGQPFVNLVTIIPVSLSGNDVTHFVGFQADMVDQPHEILLKMKDGIYYPGLTFPHISPLLSNGLSVGIDKFPQEAEIISEKFAASKEILNIMGVPSNIDDEIAARMWNTMLLDECDDFVHVLSLKGVFLYCSSSCKKMLEYEPEELVSTSLSSICDPNDLIPVLRELKETANDIGLISLVYRIKRKHSGYMWFEASGRILNDKSKNRKYAMLSGRPRSMYSLSREVVETFGGLSDNEFWIKLSLEGIILHVTSFCQSSLNIIPDDFEGTSLYQFVRSDRTTALTRALQQAKEGITVKLQHSIRNSKGQYVDVVSTFYPSSCATDANVPFVLCQAKTIPDNEGLFDNSSGPSSAPSLLTNKVATEVDNMFSVLGIENRTNWQYELHQLRIANKKLREELDSLIGSNGRRRKRQGKHGKVCSICFCKDSPEWRKGPSGSGILCNSCGTNKENDLQQSKPLIDEC